MPLETLKVCPVCTNSGFQNHLTVQDYTVSHKEFTIQQCNSCNFLFTNPRPDETTIGEYYKSNEYISHHDEVTSLVSKIYTSVRDYTIGEKLKMISRLSPGKGKILDVGCGTGNFIQACKKDGWKIGATEPDSGARKVASERVGEILSESIFNTELSKTSFDIITLWHVLEHIHQLNETIEWLREHLNPGGKIVVAVPNPESSDAQKYGRFWAAYDVPRHLYHFSKDTLKLLMKNHGMRVETIHPMWFDSFYVSMLSSKYKTGSIKLLDTALTGLRSNLSGRAAKNQTFNTSSLIYVITKL
jgi:2-polyprenyl-3-methyl-5-hydroxy-6-metoxy-1,4-benzoquinol methylase